MIITTETKGIGCTGCGYRLSCPDAFTSKSQYCGNYDRTKKEGKA